MLRPSIPVSGTRRFNLDGFEVCECDTCGKPVYIDESLARQCITMADSFYEVISNFNELGPFRCAHCDTLTSIDFSEKVQYKVERLQHSACAIKAHQS